MRLLVRNRVKDFASWKQVFDADADRAARAGLTLLDIWRDADDPNEVFFMLAVESKARAQAFMADPASAESGERSGVIDGDAHFLQDSESW